MKRKTAVIPAIAYSITSPPRLQALRRFRKAPHQNEENDHHGDIKQIQHVHLTTGRNMTSCPAFINVVASFSSRVRHQRFFEATMIREPGSRALRKPSSQSRVYTTAPLPGSPLSFSRSFNRHSENFRSTGG